MGKPMTYQLTLDYPGDYPGAHIVFTIEADSLLGALRVAEKFVVFGGLTQLVVRELPTSIKEADNE